MNDTPVTPAELFKSLRASTAALLGYDVDHLSAEQTIRTDRAVTLRLLCDHLQAQQLHGVAIDVHEFVAASEALERMVGGNPEAPPPEARFGPDHRARLRELIEKVVLAPPVDDPVEVERKAELMRREEMAASLAAGASVETAAPAPVAPQPPERPQSGNVVQLPDAAERANTRSPPLHYLADHQRQHEPWRNGPSFTVPSWPLPR